MFKKLNLSETTAGIILTLKVLPKSKSFEIVGEDEWTLALRIRVSSPAEKGKANQEIVEQLSKKFNTQVKIVSGKKSTTKKVLIENLTKTQVLKVLEKI